MAEKSEPSASRTLNFWLRPFFFEFCPQSFLIIKSIVGLFPPLSPTSHTARIPTYQLFLSGLPYSSLSLFSRSPNPCPPTPSTERPYQALNIDFHNEYPDAQQVVFKNSAVGFFSTHFSMSGCRMKHCSQWLIYSILRIEKLHLHISQVSGAVLSPYFFSVSLTRNRTHLRSLLETLPT